ncbi:MAG: ion transporter [Marinilabiliales bacterium]|nr:MAG: ion transporter [Marinilabiliales bacterium]
MKKLTRQRLHEIIFEADTKAGKIFDEFLLVFILLSVLIVILDSVQSFKEAVKNTFYILEWIFTIIFTIEYVTRIYVTRKPLKYIFSFYGLIDLLAIVPTYLSLLFIGAKTMVVIRIIRLLRVFRILKLMQFMRATEYLVASIKRSQYKILVFMMFISLIVVVLGSLVYLVEGPEHGFNSIPKSIYWAIVTLTTVGYGDISPQTVAGQAIASIVMLIGYAIIAVPTGIITSELIQGHKSKSTNTQVCHHCHDSDHVDDAHFCKTCGRALHEDEEKKI